MDAKILLWMEFTKFFGKKVEKGIYFPHLVSTIKTMVDKMIADAGYGKGMPTPEISDFG